MGTAFYAVCDKVVFVLIFNFYFFYFFLLSVRKDGEAHARIVLFHFLCEGEYFFDTL